MYNKYLQERFVLHRLIRLLHEVLKSSSMKLATNWPTNSVEFNIQAWW